MAERFMTMLKCPVFPSSAPVFQILTGYKTIEFSKFFNIFIEAH